MPRVRVSVALVLVAAAAFCGSVAPLAGADQPRIDPRLYSVPLRSFTRAVYSEAKTTYRLTSSDANFALPDTPFQKIVSRDVRSGQTRILLAAGVIDPSGDPSRPDHLADTRFLNINSAPIRAARKSFVKSRDAVRDVEHFVFDTISDKTYGIPIIPADAILARRHGDCTEHAVLAVSLLRSLGIPSRAVVGMLLAPEFEGLRNVFVFHMWAEARVGGRWVLVDATRPGGTNHNRYIAFAHHHLKTEMPLAFLRSIAAIKNLSVEYVRP